MQRNTATFFKTFMASIPTPKKIDGSPCPLPIELAEFEAHAFKLPRRQPSRQTEAVRARMAANREKAIERARNAQGRRFAILALAPENRNLQATGNAINAALSMAEQSQHAAPFAMAFWTLSTDKIGLASARESIGWMSAASKIKAWSPSAQLALNFALATDNNALEWRYWMDAEHPGSNDEERFAGALAWMIEEECGGRRDPGATAQSLEMPGAVGRWMDLLADRNPKAAQDAVRRAVDWMLTRRQSAWPQAESLLPLTKTEKNIEFLRKIARGAIERMAEALDDAGVSVKGPDLAPDSFRELSQRFAQRKQTGASHRKSVKQSAAAEFTRQVEAQKARQAAFAAQGKGFLDDETHNARMQIAATAVQLLDAPAIRWLGSQGGLGDDGWTRYVEPIRGARHTLLDIWAMATAMDKGVDPRSRGAETLSALLDSGYCLLDDARQAKSPSVFERLGHLVADWAAFDGRHAGFTVALVERLARRAARACQEDGMPLAVAEFLLEAARKNLAINNSTLRAEAFLKPVGAQIEAWALSEASGLNRSEASARESSHEEATEDAVGETATPRRSIRL